MPGGLAVGKKTMQLGEGAEDTVLHKKVRLREVDETVKHALRATTLERAHLDALALTGPWYCNIGVSCENLLRHIWDVWFTVVLTYSAITLPVKVAFIDFGIPARKLPDWYLYFEFVVVDTAFLIDLLSGFIFAYKDANGRQVFDLRLIARRYLRTYFLIDLVGCIPPSLFSWMVCVAAGIEQCSTKGFNRVGRLARMQRVPRLVRLMRLVRLHKLRSVLWEARAWLRVLKNRCVRLACQCLGLLFFVHILACGWWLVAAGQGEASLNDTWISRRTVGADGSSILELSQNNEYTPPAQWLTSVYFVLTIFTTVGVGDISGFTAPEMVYCLCSMILGGIVNGIIISEMTGSITTVNEAEKISVEQRHMIYAFGRYMQVAPSLTDEIVRTINAAPVAKSKAYDRELMKHFLTSGILPRPLIKVLPQALFRGGLVRNQFLSWARHGRATNTPSRFPLLVALACQTYYYDEFQQVYSVQDHAWNIYLVLTGTFSYCASQEMRDVASKVGVDASWNIFFSHLWNISKKGAGNLSIDQRSCPYQLFGAGSYFGDIEIILEACPRIANARSEAMGGCVLVLHRKELFKLREEFPNISRPWRQYAKQHARHRVSLYNRWRVGTHKELAARLLQQNLTMLMRRRKGLGPTPKEEFDFSNFPLAQEANAQHRRTSYQAVEIEAVPQYARAMQANVDELLRHLGQLQTDVCTLQTRVLADFRNLKLQYRQLVEHLNDIENPKSKAGFVASV